MSENNAPPLIPIGMDFRDAARCRALLDELPLTRLETAYETLAALIGGMQNTPPPPGDYLDVLEALRNPLAFVQEEMSQRYSAMPLPPASDEDGTLRRVVLMWQAMARSYVQVARLGRGDPRVQEATALICHRCIHYGGKVILEYFRARRELPRDVWSDLHSHYAAAEKLGLATEPVVELFNEDSNSESCATAYAAVLLIDLSDPYGRSPREFSWTCRWARRFAPLTRIMPPEESDPPRTYGVDLLLDRGLRPLGQQARGENLRRLESIALAQKMQELLALLRQNTTPASLGLGEDCSQPATSRLLLQLFRPWCLAAAPRRFQRRQAAGVAQLCSGFDSIHYYVSGKEFTQPDHVRVYSREEFDTIVTFRYQVDPDQPLHVHTAQMGFVLEHWQVVDESVSGFRLQRAEEGCRIEHGELIALRPPDGGRFLLCRVSWLMFAGTGNLFAGVFVLPGAPEGIAARPTGLTVSPSEKYVRAFYLPAVAALKEKPSLVLPRGWFRPERVIEIYAGRTEQVRLVELLTQGSNFDRVSFVPLPTRH